MEGWSVFLFLTWIMAGGGTIETRTVRNVDLQRYMGTWYEIARFDHRFERNLVGVTAHYSLKENGKIRVVNSGHKWNLKNKMKEIRGKAFVPDLADPGKLRVSFFPLIYSDYYILELEPERYDWALVGSSTDKYLWILSRTPHLEPETLSKILTKARGRGYNINKLIFVPQ